MPYTFKVDDTVHRKLGLIERCLPFKNVIDFGGMWEVDGYYSKQCLDRFGASQATMVDAEESENWRRDPSLRKGVDFRRGDFADERFMASLSFRYDLGIAFDVLLHQIDLRHTLSLMLSKVRRSFVITNPVIPDKLMSYRNGLILLSGSKENRLIPFHEEWTEEAHYWSNFRDPSMVHWNHWLWGMSPSFIQSLMAGLGWELVHREIWRSWLPKNTQWKWGGFVFRRDRTGRNRL